MTHDLVIFDLGGVVVEFNADRVVHHMAQLLGRSFDEVQQAVYRKDRLLPLELGQISPRQYYEGLKQELGLTWTYEQFVPFWNDIFEENQDVVAMMGRLRKWHKLYALSNTNQLHIVHLRATSPALSLFHEIVASCEVGLRKPDPAIYQLALTRAGARADRTVYIDDRPELVEAGRAVGLTAVRFENSRQLSQDLQSIGLNL